MKYYRSIFISDLHLGSPWCRAQDLINFIDSVECERFYLVGDIFDNWHLSRNHTLSEKQLEVWERLLNLAKKIEMTYVTGNHDDFLRSGRPYSQLFKSAFSGMNLCRSSIHLALNGKKYLVTHGDAYDPALHLPFLADLVTFFYENARAWLNRFSGLSKHFNYEKIDNRLMHWQELATRLLGNSQTKMLAAVKSESLDGVICGHTHLAANQLIDGLIYANCGYWSGPSHALVEQTDGSLELLAWETARSANTNVNERSSRPQLRGLSAA